MGWHAIEGGKKFLSNWHIDAISEHLQAVLRGYIMRLAISMPPRHMKSTGLVMMCPYDWIDNPWRQYLFASYAQPLSIRDSVKTRRVIQSPWYQECWGERYGLAGDQNAKMRFDNTKNGYRLATSVGGVLTGEGGDIIVIDDPNNVREAESEAVREETNLWWDEAMSTRLNSADGRFIVVQQRVHERDMTGHIMAKERSEWTYLCLPARYEKDHPFVWVGDPRTQDGEPLWPNRFSAAHLDKLAKSMGAYAAAGQLQQRPAPREGGMFKRSWFKVIDAIPVGARTIVRRWDLAGTEESATSSDPDWTAGVKMSRLEDGRFLIEHVIRFRESPAQVEATMKQLATMDGLEVTVGIPQDPGQAGVSQVLHLTKVLAGFAVKAYRETGDKVTRSNPLSSQLEVGNVLLLRGDWNEDFISEFTTFPTGSHDDQVDAASGALAMLTEGNTGMLDYLREQAEAHQRELEAKKQEAGSDQHAGG